MEWIILIGIVIFALNLSNKRQSQKKRSTRQLPTTYTATGSTAERFPSTGINISGDTEAENNTQGPIRPVERTYSPSFGSEGESLLNDPYGCAGGSMAHDSHEGLEFAGHKHITPTSAYTAVKPVSYMEKPTRQPIHRAGLTAAQMRNAVIMAEILAKPVSCRRR